MLTTKDAMLAHLAGLGIDQLTTLHPPVFTVEEAQLHTRHVPGAHCKNLFLKDRKDRLWLVTCLDDQQVDLKRLSKLVGAAGFSFGKAELLQAVLGVSRRCSIRSCWRMSRSTATRCRTTPPRRCAAATCCASYGRRATSRC
jgi:hypothetical protein